MSKEEMEEEIHRLKTALWDIAIICGKDIDPQDNYNHLVKPDIVDFAKDAVKELNTDYDLALEELSMQTVYEWRVNGD